MNGGVRMISLNDAKEGVCYHILWMFGLAEEVKGMMRYETSKILKVVSKNEGGNVVISYDDRRFDLSPELAYCIKISEV